MVGQSWQPCTARGLTARSGSNVADGAVRARVDSDDQSRGMSLLVLAKVTDYDPTNMDGGLLLRKEQVMARVIVTTVTIGLARLCTAKSRSGGGGGSRPREALMKCSGTRRDDS